MKARNNNTGEVVTNFGFSKEFGTVSYIDSKGVLTFNTPNSCEWTIIDEEEMNFDWRSFRAEAAKDVLCAMIPEQHNIIGPNNVEYAIMIADELIKQLKEKEEK
jgi:hypothetical protein